MSGRIAGQGSNWIRREKRLAIYRRDGFRCVYCGTDLAGAVATLDHVTPCELGGTNNERNLVTACLSCNSAKRDLPLRRFLTVLADRGVDPDSVKGAIRRQTRRTLVK